MSEARANEARVRVPPARIRAILADPAALGRVLPHCESAVGAGLGRTALVLGVRMGFLTVRADVDATLAEPDGPDGPLRLTLDGRTRGFDGGFHAEIPFALEPLDGGRATLVRYSVSADATGAVAMAGSGGIAGVLESAVGELVENLEREASRPG